jgi:transcriptional regulator with XRE-family HTH domain
MQAPETLGQRLRRTRTQRVMTQAELAQAAGIAIITANRLENDAIENPRPATVRKLAHVLNIDPAWLLFGEEDLKAAA